MLFRQSWIRRSLHGVSALALLAGLLGPLVGLPGRPASAAGSLGEPRVAIHVSELTLALESLPASGATPTGAGTTGRQWWLTEWHAFVMAEALQEALRSDGTPYTLVSDADLAAGALLTTDGSPRFPIVFSLATEAAGDAQVAALRAYANAGGFLFLGSSALTRTPDGASRGDFALAAEMGLHTLKAGLDNWYLNNRFTRQASHRLVAHIPAGTLEWRLPLSADEVPWGTYPNYAPHGDHKAWAVTTAGADVLATGSSGPLLTTRAYGAGRLIYYGVLQPLIGHGGFDDGMYSYVLFRRAIEWAFEAAGRPIVKVSPWPYAYDAAFVMRHDLENWAVTIQNIDQSALYEYSHGARGDYYFSTGVLRLGSADHQLTDAQKADAIARLRTAVAIYGATIGSHNGGLPNPAPNALQPSDYEYWHWGPDEAYAFTPAGYASGYDYALASLAASFQDVAGWLTGIDNGRPGCGAAGNCPRTWVSPFFNAAREQSYQLLAGLGVVTAGEQKLSAFPHWTVSTQTSGLRYPHLSLPVSEWYVDNLAQSLDTHTSASLDAAVDFYYDLGALINIYSHSGSDQDVMTQRYILRNAGKPRNWAANAVQVYDWWTARSPVVVSPAYSQSGNQAAVTASVSGAVDPQTAIELVLPNYAAGDIANVQVYLDGAPADPAQYRFTAYGLKIRVGAAASAVEVRYTVGASGTPATPSATPRPTDTATPTTNAPLPFPSTGTLDTFNRAAGPLGTNWAGAAAGYAIANNQVDVGSGDAVFWQVAPFAPDQEAQITLTTIDPAAAEIDLLLKSQASSSWGGGVIEVVYVPGARAVQVWTYAPGQGWVQRGSDLAVTFLNGDRFGARARAGGMVEVYRNGSLVGSRDAAGWPFASGGGYIGLWMAGAANAVLDDFGGGATVAGPATPPTSPPSPTSSATAAPTTATGMASPTPTATAAPPTASPTPTATAALPTASPTPTAAGALFPTAGLLDTFNRADGVLGAYWGGSAGGYRLLANQLRVGLGDAILWSPTAFGADQEVYVTFAAVDAAGAEQDLLLKSQSAAGWTGGVIEVLYDAAAGRIQVWTYSASQGWVQRGTDLPAAFVGGDRFGARATAAGAVEIYRNGSLLGIRDASAWTYRANGGYVGLWFAGASAAVLDDFGGGAVGLAATNTPPPTATSTAPPTATHTPLPTATSMPLPSATSTPLPTATSTPLPTATSTPLPSATSTPLPTATNTPLPTATNTPLPTATSTPTQTPNPSATTPEGSCPSSPVLDGFNRANGALGTNWSGSVNTAAYAIAGNQVDVAKGGDLYWKAASFGVSQEAFVTLSTVGVQAAEQDLLLKVQGTTPSWKQGVIEVLFSPRGGTVTVETFRPGATWVAYPAMAAAFANGDRLGARARSNGVIEIYRNCTLVSSVVLNSADQAFFNARGGRIGLWYVSGSDAFFDDFGGGTAAP